MALTPPTIRGSRLCSTPSITSPLMLLSDDLLLQVCSMAYPQDVFCLSVCNSRLHSLLGETYWRQRAQSLGVTLKPHATAICQLFGVIQAFCHGCHTPLLVSWESVARRGFPVFIGRDSNMWPDALAHWIIKRWFCSTCIKLPIWQFISENHLNLWQLTSLAVMNEESILVDGVRWYRYVDVLRVKADILRWATAQAQAQPSLEMERSVFFADSSSESLFAEANSLRLLADIGNPQATSINDIVHRQDTAVPPAHGHGTSDAAPPPAGPAHSNVLPFELWPQYAQSHHQHQQQLYQDYATSSQAAENMVRMALGHADATSHVGHSRTQSRPSLATNSAQSSDDYFWRNYLLPAFDHRPTSTEGAGSGSDVECSLPRPPTTGDNSMTSSREPVTATPDTATSVAGQGTGEIKPKSPQPAAGSTPGLRAAPAAPLGGESVAEASSSAKVKDTGSSAANASISQPDKASTSPAQPPAKKTRRPAAKTLEEKAARQAERDEAKRVRAEEREREKQRRAAEREKENQRRIARKQAEIQKQTAERAARQAELRRVAQEKAEAAAAAAAERQARRRQAQPAMPKKKRTTPSRKRKAKRQPTSDEDDADEAGPSGSPAPKAGPSGSSSAPALKKQVTKGSSLPAGGYVDSQFDELAESPQDDDEEPEEADEQDEDASVERDESDSASSSALFANTDESRRQIMRDVKEQQLSAALLARGYKLTSDAMTCSEIRAWIEGRWVDSLLPNGINCADDVVDRVVRTWGAAAREADGKGRDGRGRSAAASITAGTSSSMLSEQLLPQKQQRAERQGGMDPDAPAHQSNSHYAVSGTASHDRSLDQSFATANSKPGDAADERQANSTMDLVPLDGDSGSGNSLATMSGRDSGVDLSHTAAQPANNSPDRLFQLANLSSRSSSDAQHQSLPVRQHDSHPLQQYPTLPNLPQFSPNSYSSLRGLLDADYLRGAFVQQASGLNNGHERRGSGSYGASSGGYHLRSHSQDQQQLQQSIDLQRYRHPSLSSAGGSHFDATNDAYSKDSGFASGSRDLAPTAGGKGQLFASSYASSATKTTEQLTMAQNRQTISGPSSPAGHKDETVSDPRAVAVKKNGANAPGDGSPILPVANASISATMNSTLEPTERGLTLS
ncbi:hypothetical protein BDZ90DRAFT_64255 [Jaminaea rosea]|uniref:Uncharacterized protein n=1 Tax=Jaminaea rosea TaxID=1569628 RepID=A0A316UKK8_9BASI|nr:hypothetical protein BDZ90DRAFT_64255 [Jaminaea rosea]PWN25832.1 hypothetical protein BDZ90DRAFT_64255 [Jaminaea rosea]